MSWHPSEDDLVLAYYREHTDAEARRIEDHLHICASCGDDWQRITATMAALDRMTVPDPGADFESRVWNRFAAELPSHRRGWTLRQMVMVGSWAAVIGLVAGAGLTWRAVQPTAPAEVEQVSTVSPEEMRERVLLTALNDHFTQTEMLLVELMNAPESTSELAFERETADDLVTSGRLYRQTAIQNGNGQLAAMLDDIEGVLTEVARRPDPLGAGEIDALRTRIEDDDLLFKVRAVTTEVRSRRRALMQ